MQMFAHGLKDLLMLFLIFIVFIIGLGLLLVGGVYTEEGTGRQKTLLFERKRRRRA